MPNEAERMIRIKALRLARGMTQRQLADAVGVVQGYISRLERGKGEPSPDVLRRLAEALGVSPGALYERDGLEARIMALFERIPADRQNEALAMIEAMAKALSKK